MILLPPTASYWIATEPVDLRRSFDVLVQLALERLGQDVRAGAVVFFFNRARDRCKAVFHDRSGLVILYKRLDRGRFYAPGATSADGRSVVLGPGELAHLLDGLAPLPPRRR